jgi:tetratricopeptide (TPR) repeat protein
MESFTEKLTKISTIVTNVLILLTPLFFLPVTREFIIISKVYFFIYGVIALLVLAFIYVAVSRKAVWEKNVMINSLMLLLVSSALSIIIMSPNKMQALFLPHGGFVVILAFVVYYLFAERSARQNKENYLFFIALSGLISSIIAIVSFIQPFKNLKLPAEIAFLNNPAFNTVGTQLDYIIFTIFVLIASAAYLFSNKTIVNQHRKGNSVIKNIFYIVFTISLISLVLQVFQIGRAVIVNNEDLVLPPLSISWYSAVEILKNPFTALFGVGVGNYSAIFTQVKDATYNASNLWQVSSFNISRSAFMHVLTEMGLLGGLALAFAFLTVIRSLKLVRFTAAALMIYALISFVIFPPSFINYFILFTSLAYFTAQLHRKDQEVYVADLGKLLPVFITSVVLFAVFIGGVTYFTSISFASEIMYKRAIDAITSNDLRRLYDYQRQAIMINPYNEDFRRSFSQTNLLVANNIARKDPKDITDQDRQTITQAIQASIAEAKAAVALNPRKVTNWQYLASVYRNIINVAEGAELWTVASYQRAILLDPQNPIYRLELGGVYYLLKSYPDAQRMFEQAISLKPEWANANYNLAWTLHQQEDYPAAVTQMERVLTLIDQKTNKTDYEQAKKDLATFREKAKAVKPELATDATNKDANVLGADTDPLSLPTPPVATFEPKIELPETASPEANVVPQGTQR